MTAVSGGTWTGRLPRSSGRPHPDTTAACGGHRRGQAGHAATAAVGAPAAVVPAGMPQAARPARLRWSTRARSAQACGRQRPTRRGHRPRRPNTRSPGPPRQRTPRTAAGCHGHCGSRPAGQPTAGHTGRNHHPTALVRRLGRTLRQQRPDTDRQLVRAPMVGSQPATVRHSWTSRLTGDGDREGRPTVAPAGPAQEQEWFLCCQAAGRFGLLVGGSWSAMRQR